MGVQFWEYVRSHWVGYVVLVIALLVTVLIAMFSSEQSPWQQLSYNVGAGILSLLLFQVFTDFKNIRFVANLLDNHQLSFHIGARLHGSHHNVIGRTEAISKFLAKTDTFRLLTSTADDYVLSDRSGYKVLQEKLKDGLKLQILLFTPVFHLRSYLDRTAPLNCPGGLTLGRPEDVTHGQSHRHASELIYLHFTTIIPAIEKLRETYPGQVEVRFFHIKHHVNMAIYGSKRIFAAPLLSGTEGRDLPCLEVFPGLIDTKLFDKLFGEFKYLWEKRNLTFELDEMKKIYECITTIVPTYFAKSWMSAENESKVEDFAHQLMQQRANATTAHSAVFRDADS